MIPFYEPINPDSATAVADARVLSVAAITSVFVRCVSQHMNNNPHLDQEANELALLNMARNMLRMVIDVYPTQKQCFADLQALQERLNLRFTTRPISETIQ